VATPVVSAPTVQIRRLTLDEVYAMADAGILEEDERVELEDGVLVELRPQDVKHEAAKEWLNWYFGQAGLRVRVEAMFLTGDGYRLPDLQVAESFLRTEHPRSVPLAIEVANTSLSRDRAKAARYARAGIPDYWIVDVVGEVVIVHRDPSGEEYATVTEHRDGTVQPLLPAPPLALDELFGRERVRRPAS
jgi:Uma2 family endonuclease